MTKTEIDFGQFTNEHRKYVWLATTNLIDYFSRLGGSARPSGMDDSEITLYVAGKIIKLYANSKFKEFDKSPRWKNFGKYLVAKNS